MEWITVTSDFKEIKKAVKKMNDELLKVKELTKKDFKSRVPAQVNKGIKAHYKSVNRIGKGELSWPDSGEIVG